MCIICTMLDKDKIKWDEAQKVAFSGEIPLEPVHFQEILDKIREKKKQAGDES